jgi:hypothetical protein
MLRIVASLLISSMQDEETLRTVREVVIKGLTFMECGVGAPSRDSRFARFGLDGAKAKCDLVPTIIGIVESKNIEWAMRGAKAEEEPEVRKSLSFGAYYVLMEYYREFKDKRVEEYFRQVAFDRARLFVLRNTAASYASGMFTASWPAFAVEALRKHRDLCNPLLSSLNAIHMSVPAERYRDYYTDDVAKALREYIAATPASYVDSTGAKWIRTLADDLDAGRIPRPSFARQEERKAADPPKTDRDIPQKK